MSSKISTSRDFSTQRGGSLLSTSYPTNQAQNCGGNLVTSTGAVRPSKLTTLIPVSAYTMCIDRLELVLVPKVLIFDYRYITTHFVQGAVPTVYNISKGVYLIYTHEHTEKNYQYSFRIQINEKNVGYLSTNCKRHDKYIKLKFDKEHLYNGAWHDYLTIIQNVFPLKYQSIHYKEIAFDIDVPVLEAYGKMWNEAFERRFSVVKRYKHHRKISVSTLDNENAFIIGTGNLKKKSIKIYEKANGTDYQKEFWKTNGLNPDKINRIEVRLGSDELGKHRKIDPSELNNLEFLRGLFVKMVGKNLVVKDLSSKFRDHNNNYKFDEIQLIDTTAISTMEIDLKKPDKVTLVEDKGLHRNRVAVHELIENFIIRGDEKIWEVMRKIDRSVGFSNYLRIVDRYNGKLNPEIENRIRELKITLKTWDDYAQTRKAKPTYNSSSILHQYASSGCTW